MSPLMWAFGLVPTLIGVAFYSSPSPLLVLAMLAIVALYHLIYQQLVARRNSATGTAPASRSRSPGTR